jgi:hypothetical protein
MASHSKKNSRIPKEQPLLKISISGPGVKPGRIKLPVLFKICQEAQAAVNRQAEAIEASMSEKPLPESVLRDCTLELIALKKGSTTLDFAPASKQPFLIPEMASVGIDAVSAVATTMRAASRKRGKWKAPDPNVLDVLDDLGEVFTQGVNKLKWIVPRQNGHRGTRAEFDPATLLRVKRRKQESLPLHGQVVPYIAAEAEPLAATVPPPPFQESFLEGMLELGDGKVRITPATGAPTTLSYAADKFENILGALHKPVRVKVDAKARKLVDIEITGAFRDFDTSSFFEAKGIEQLIAEQRVQPIADLSVLGGAIPDEDVDEFVADIYRDRES